VPETKLRRILLADNDEDVLLALERTLEDRGYATATALSHPEACKLLAQARFDLWVLDDYLSDKDKRAHSELSRMVDSLFEPRTTRHPDAFDVMT